MNDHCTFYKEHKCIKWADYELLRYELEEANEVCHGNWGERFKFCVNRKN